MINVKLFIKNNIKIFATILITTIVVGSISVYAATQYLAHDISFTPSQANQEKGFNATNVNEALDQLYESSKKEISFMLQAQGFKGNGNVKAITNIIDIRKHFKIIPGISNNNTLCSVEYWTSSSSGEMVENQEYITSDYIGTAILVVMTPSSTTNFGQCTKQIIYYD